MIKDIVLWTDNPQKDRISNIVRVDFTHPVKWAVFKVEDLKKILRLWNEGEEMKYPLEKGFMGRWMLFNEILEVFNEGLPESQKRKVVRYENT